MEEKKLVSDGSRFSRKVGEWCKDSAFVKGCNGTHGCVNSSYRIEKHLRLEFAKDLLNVSLEVR